MSGPSDLHAAREHAREEKALAKQRLVELKSSLAPSAVLARLGGRAGTKATGAVTLVRDVVRAHPVLAASSVATVGLFIAAKPLGEFLAAELDGADREGNGS